MLCFQMKHHFSTLQTLVWTSYPWCARLFKGISLGKLWIGYFIVSTSWRVNEVMFDAKTINRMSLLLLSYFLHWEHCSCEFMV